MFAFGHRLRDCVWCLSFDALCLVLVFCILCFSLVRVLVCVPRFLIWWFCCCVLVCGCCSFHCETLCCSWLVLHRVW